MAIPLAPTRFPLLAANIPQRILLAEDNPADLARLKEVISSMHPPLELVDVAGFADAVEELHKQHFDAVLLSLKVMESECVKAVAEHTEAPIIVLTNLENDPVALDALQNGADDYLVKHSVDRDRLQHD